VVKSYPDSPVAPLAKLSRGVLRVQRGGGEEEQGVADLKAVAEQAKVALAETPLRADVLAGLRKASAALAARGNAQATIDLLLAEQSLDPHLPASFFARLADAYEKRAEQVEQSLADAPAEDKVKRAQLAREFCLKAGDAQLSYSRALLAAGEKDYLEPFWKALDLYERGDASGNVVAALELFVTERADDAAAPDALLRLARAYQSLGQTDKAMSAYGRLQGAYPKSPAATKAALALAVLLEKQPDKAQAAKTVLLGIVNNAAVAQDSDEYKQALFELASLNCRGGEWREATPRLEQFVAKYPADARAGEAAFLLGECYRDAAQQIDGQLAGANARAAAGAWEKAMAAKMEQWRKAAVEYDRAQQVYSAATPTGEAQQKYLKLAALRRADCAYESGAYADAVTLYNRVAARYPDDPVALAASVQVVNSYCLMNRLGEARAANERARALLARMPKGAFEQGGFEMPKAYWEQWLKWTATAAAAAM
jgi:TolA-binding protein